MNNIWNATDDEMRAAKEIKNKFFKMVEEKNFSELDKLINDKSWIVRKVVAEQGYGLDKLIDDRNSFVRAEVARQGYGLDKLINDKSWIVRKVVAEQGYGLDKLINDEVSYVREVVAEQGYGLDKLINDSSPYVRWMVVCYLDENNLTIDEWKEQQNIFGGSFVNISLEFIRKSADAMYTDKMDNMYESEISEEVYDFLVDKKEEIVNAICEIFRENAIVNKEYCLRVLDGFTYDLIDNWDMYDEFEELDDLDDEMIHSCSQETMNSITYDALYNYDALWMTAIQKGFPDKVTDTQCGCGMIEFKEYDLV